MNKKYFLFFSLILTFLALNSCTTQDFKINRAYYDKPQIATPPFEAYTVLGQVSGVGTVNNKKNAKGFFEGDTNLYGSLDYLDAIYLELSPKPLLKPKTPFDAALSNAIYQMNEKADAMKADAILFVRTKTAISTRNGITTTEVTITGIAIKLK